MENKRQKVLTYLGAAVIALLLIGILFTLGSNKKNRRNLNTEKIAESEKKINSLSGENRSLRAKQKELEELKKPILNLKKCHLSRKNCD